eukprot:401712-Amphidinium_carterae.1
MFPPRFCNETSAVLDTPAYVQSQQRGLVCFHPQEHVSLEAVARVDELEDLLSLGHNHIDDNVPFEASHGVA